MNAGATIGQYRVTKLIGLGGMGSVYAAEHTLLGRTVAIKVLLPEFTQNADIVQRFFNEARATTAIHHPGIVEVFDFGWTSEGAAYIVMELLRGESLAARIESGRVSWAQAVVIVRQLAGVLAAAHAQGIVHRDLKPDNVFLIPDPEVPGGERVKLLDFGIAKLVNHAVAANKTRTGSVLGTPTYMAPEQCRGVAIDHRADLYAVGCVLFELLTGRPPFDGEGSGDILAAHIHVPAPLTSQFVPGVPADLEALVQSLLVKQPAQRLQTAAELVKAVDALGSLGTGAHAPMTVLMPAPEPVPTLAAMPTTLSGAASARVKVPSTRNKLLTAGVVAVLASAAAGIAVVAQRDPQTPQTIVEPIAAVDSVPLMPPPPAPAPTWSSVPTPPPAPPPPPAPTIELVKVDIESTPAGAQVLLDDQVLGVTPFHGEVPRAAREAKLVVKLSGFQTKTVTVSVDSAIAQRLTLDAKASPSKPPKRPPAPPPDRDGSVNPF